MYEKIFVAASGVINSIGGDPAMTAAAVQAGLSNVTDTAFLNKRYADIKLASVPDDALTTLDDLELTDLRHKRCVALADYALKQLCEQLSLTAPVALFVAGPEALPKVPHKLDVRFIQQLAGATGLPLDVAQSRWVSSGRAGGLHVLDMASKYLSVSGASYCLVGGVDSPFDPRLLAQLDVEDRLNVADNTDGFIPGEGAAFLLLASSKLKTSLPNKSAAWLPVCQPAFGNELGHRYSDQAYLGDAMADTVRSALAMSTNPKPFSHLYTSLNGESFGAKELGVAMTRNSKILGGDLDIEHPADCFGDLGAAFVPTVLSCLLYDNSQRVHPARRLLTAASDLDSRAAVVIEPSE